jgi:hypothetical protein
MNMADLIVIDITENEKILLDGSLNYKGINGNGKILIKNPSSQSRLWNLNCDLKETVNTNINSRELAVGILNPNQEYTLEYEVQNLKESTLKVNEIFDSERAITEINCSIKIELINPLDIPISNIRVVKEISKSFQEIELNTPIIGNASVVLEQGQNLLNWEIVTLESNQKAELIIEFNLNPQKKASISLGSLVISYIVNNHKLTMLNPEIRGLTDSISEIHRDKDSQLGTWNCNVEFINDSDFQVRLEDVKVSHKTVKGIERVLSKAPNRLLNPEESWSLDFQVESKNVPELNSTIEFTPLFLFIKRVIGEIKKDSTYIIF